MNMQQLTRLETNNFKINLILIKNHIFIWKLITSAGIFYKIIVNDILNVLNLQRSLLLKGLINKKNLTTINISSVIKSQYALFYYKRYYLKLKGLGFSFKYLIIPQHSLLLNIGFSKLRFIKIPPIISIIKKPRKKKNIFILTSINFNALLEFIAIIRKLKIPDPYKIKGFRYINEAIKVKTGKKKK